MRKREDAGRHSSLPRPIFNPCTASYFFCSPFPQTAPLAPSLFERGLMTRGDLQTLLSQQGIDASDGPVMCGPFDNFIDTLELPPAIDLPVGLHVYSCSSQAVRSHRQLQGGIFFWSAPPP
eukprot:scaffold22299_cov40-Tisochrysis_lutea.AAC.1